MSVSAILDVHCGSERGSLLFPITAPDAQSSRRVSLRTQVVAAVSPGQIRRSKTRTRVFFFPSGWRVERHVLQGIAPGGAVRQSTWGRVEDVPVPSRMSSTLSSSTGLVTWTDGMAVGYGWVSRKEGMKKRQSVGRLLYVMRLAARRWRRRRI
jgi:hypothetical protein